LVNLKIISNLKKDNPKINKNDLDNIVSSIFNQITKNLLEGNPVEIRNFGRWSLKNIKERYNSRNPKTGEIIYVPEKKKISFKMSKKLKEEINKTWKKKYLLPSILIK